MVNTPSIRVTFRRPSLSKGRNEIMAPTEYDPPKGRFTLCVKMNNGFGNQHKSSQRNYEHNDAVEG
jgi:hypothetical protein